MSERGKIRNREHAVRIRDFSGMRWGKITPSDLDCYVEFGGRLFVFIELKYAKARTGWGQSWPATGQERAYRALVDKLEAPAVFLLATHEAEEGDIDVASATVTDICVNRHLFGKDWLLHLGAASMVSAPGGQMLAWVRVDGGRPVRHVVDLVRAALGIEEKAA